MPSHTDPRGNSSVRSGTQMGRNAHEIGNLAFGALSRLPFARIQWQTRTHIQAKFGNRHGVQIIKSNSEANDSTWGQGYNICVHTHRCPRGLGNIFISHLFLHPFIKFYKMKYICVYPEGRGKWIKTNHCIPCRGQCRPKENEAVGCILTGKPLSDFCLN